MSIDKLFPQSFFHSENFTNMATSFPPYNIYQESDNFVIELAVAGYNKDEISVKLDGDALLVSGIKSNTEQEGRKYIVRGVAGRKFVRKFAISTPSIRLKVSECKFSDGMLTIVLVKDSDHVVNIQIS